MSKPGNPPTPGVEISKKLVLINSSSSLIAMALSITVLVWVTQYLLDKVSTEEYSLLPVLNSIMMFIPLITVVLTSALGRYIIEAYAAKDLERVTQIVSTMTPILAGAGAVMAVIGCTASFYIDYILTVAPEHLDDARLMFALLMLSLSLKLVLAPHRVGLYARQKIVLLNFINTSAQFLRIGVLFLLLTSVSARVLWVVVATVSADALAQMIIVFLSRRALPSLRFRRDAIRWPLVRQLMSFGGWSAITGVAMAIQNSADAILLNKLGSPIDVTCYYLGSLPQQQIIRSSSVVLQPLNPVLIAMHATKQKDRLRSVFLKGGRWALWFSLFVGTPLMAYSREVILLYVGPEYEMAGIVMILILLSFPFGQGTRMLYPLAEATAKVRTLSLYLIAMSSFNLMLTLYLVGILHMGALGSGIGSATAVVLFYPLLLSLALRIADVKALVWLKKTLIPGILPTLTSLVVLLGLKLIIPLDSWLRILICVSVGSAIYLITVLCCLQAEDKNDLTKAAATAAKWPGVPALIRLIRGRWGAEPT